MYRVLVLVLFVTTTSVVLIGTPGYFSHHELQIMDSLALSDRTRGTRSLDTVRNTAFYRPLGYETLRALLDTGGTSYPIVPHGALVLLHALVCVIVFYLVKELDSEKLAFASAALFAVSPLAAFAVGWIAGIYDVLVTGFMAVATFAGIRLVRGGGGGWSAVFLLATIGAAGSKETWVVLPLMLFLVGLTGKTGSRSRALAVVVASGVAVVLYLVVRYPALFRLAEGGAGGYGVAVGENVLRNLFAYMAFPFDPEAAEITGIADRGLSIDIGFSLFALVAVLLAARSTCGKSWRVVALCVAVWLTYLLPVLPIGKYETQYMYGAGVPLAYLVAALICSEAKGARALGVAAIGVLTWHTAVIQFNMYETGRCQSRLLASLDTLFASRGGERSVSHGQVGIAADAGTRWWVLARALTDSGRASDGRRFVRFSWYRDEAQMVFTKSCTVIPRDVQK